MNSDILMHCFHTKQCPALTQHRVGTCMDPSVWKQISSEISYKARGFYVLCFMFYEFGDIGLLEDSSEVTEDIFDDVIIITSDPTPLINSNENSPPIQGSNS